MEHVAEQSNFTLDFSQGDRDLWNATSEASRPKSERPYLDPLPLVNVFALATKERVQADKTLATLITLQRRSRRNGSLSVSRKTRLDKIVPGWDL